MGENGYTPRQLCPLNRVREISHIAVISKRRIWRVTQNGRAGTIFRPKKASYAPAGYQNDLIDLALPRKRSISASCETDTRALDSQGLAALAGDIFARPKSLQPTPSRSPFT